MRPDAPDGPVVVASLQNAKQALQTALDHCTESLTETVDYEARGEAVEFGYWDAAYDEVEQIQRLLDTLTERLFGEREG